MIKSQHFLRKKEIKKFLRINQKQYLYNVINERKSNENFKIKLEMINS